MGIARKEGELKFAIV